MWKILFLFSVVLCCSGQREGSATSDNDSLCNDGDLRAEQQTVGLSFLSADGDFISNTSLVLTACIDGSFGGVCRQNFDDVDAALACSFLGYNYGGEVASDQSNSYTGPIVLQDVSCTGQENSTSQCNISTDITSDCFSSSNIVRINCFSVISIPCDDSGALFPVQTSGSIFFGNIENPYTAQLAFCINGTTYGVCRTGFDNTDALVACRSFLQFTSGLDIIRAEVVTDLYTNNMGPLYLQDIACDGTETSYTECMASTELDSDCMDPSRAVGVRCFFEVGSTSGSGTLLPPVNSFPPVELYPTGPEFGDIFISLGDDTSFAVPFTIRFAGALFNTVHINSNGVLSLGSPFTSFDIRNFPIMSPPLIAPFWLDLNPLVNGSISYRYLTNTSFIDVGINSANGFSFPPYVSSSALLVTWDEVVIFGQSEITETFQVVLSTNGSSSYVYFLYSDELYPSGATIGINVGDGVNFVQDTSSFDSSRIAEGTNIPIFFMRGLYVYRLDNLTGSPTSGNVSLCNDGDLRAEQQTMGLSFTSADGDFIFNTSLLLTVCTSGSFGGICQRNFDDVDAALACTFLGYDYGGEVASDQSNSYTGPIVIQDVSCTGQENSTSQCNVSTDITPDCFSSSNIVRINCFLNTMQPPAPVCSTGDLLLSSIVMVNATSITAQPLVCINETFGSICRVGFDSSTASVICRSYFEAQFNLTASGEPVYDLFQNYTGPVAVQNVQCDGSEESILECPVSTDIDETCYTPSATVGVRCDVQVPQCMEGQIIFTPGNTNFGSNLVNVEAQPTVCVNGIFGSFCGDGVTPAVLNTACQQLSMSFFPSFDVIASAMISSFNGTTRVVAQDLNCEGDVASLENCTYSTIVNSPCDTSGQSLSIQCTLSAPAGPTASGMNIPDLLAPFGTEVGDNILLRSPYANSREIFLSPAFPYYGQNMTSVFINSNGFLSFRTACDATTCDIPRPFPFSSPPLIATLWSSYLAEDPGNVYYRLTRDPIFLRNISNYIQLQTSAQFLPSYAVVATWYEVSQRPSIQGLTNTFQVILATDGYTSYVAFSYGRRDIPIVTYAGFNFGDGVSFTNLETAGIEFFTNVENDTTRGRYLFRVNDLPLAACQNGDIRETQLRTESSASEYIVTSLIEVCINGVFGAVCDRNVNNITVLFACNSLGYGNAIRGELVSDPYLYNGQVLLESISCTGNESSAQFCDLDFNVSAECINTARAAKVRCYYPIPPENGSAVRQDDLFLPFGEEANDTEIPPGCNLYSQPIYLSPSFPYYGRNQSTVFINSDGYFSFGEIFTSCCNVFFPTISPPLIAVLWRGYNTSRFGGEGSVTYRVARDPATLDIISDFISTSQLPFMPSYAVVATWNMVPTDNSQDFSRYSFQAVLATNGRTSFVIFSYGNLDGIGSVQVGFNLGDGNNYGPESPFIANAYLFSSVDIHLNSNTGIAGLYSYRVDDLTSPISPTTISATTVSPTATSFPSSSCFEGEYTLLTVDSISTTDRNLQTSTTNFYVPLLCVNGTRGYICDRGWDDDDAAVVCGRNQFIESRAILGVMLNDSFPPVNYVIQDVNCSANSFGIQDCDFRPADNSQCGVGGSSVAGVTCEELPLPCQDGQVRMVDPRFSFPNGYQAFSGRVEICYNRTYTAICAGGLTEDSAVSICSFSQNSPHYTASVYDIEGWQGDIIPSAECNRTSFGGIDCQTSNSDTCPDSSRVVGITCNEVISPCFNDGNLRYTNEVTISNTSGTYFTARPEVCFNGTYGSICDKYFTQETAQFICRDVYATSSGQVISSPNLNSAPRIALQSISGCQSSYSCSGADFTITDPDCQGSDRAVGISCSRVCYDGETRLVGGSVYYEGVVEICRNGTWGVICDQGWNGMSAAVLCQEKGFGAGGSTATFGWSSQRPIVSSNVTCDLRFNDGLSNCLNCTVIPQGCTSQTIAGARCQPGSLRLNIVSDGTPEYDSPFSLRCNGEQGPFNSSLERYQWTDSQGIINNDDFRSTRVVPSGLELFGELFYFNTSLDFQSLRVEDAGIYNCSMSINVTYPDGPSNSSSIITNTTYYALWVTVPAPIIDIFARPPPYMAAEELITTCYVSTVPGVSIQNVNIGWYDSINDVPIMSDSRVIVGDTMAVNSTFYSRSITVNSLIGSDTGNYTCRSSISGPFFFSDESSVDVPLIVEGVPENSSAPLVNAEDSTNQFLLEGEALTISFSIEATPEVQLESISWFFEQVGTNTPVSITARSMLEDGSAQLEFSSDRLSLTLTNVTVNASGLYYISATNIAGTGTNFTVVTVFSSPQVMLQPLNPIILDTIDSQLTITASCTARGSPRPYITWSATTMNGSNILFDPSQVDISEPRGNGIVMSRLTLPGTSIEQRGATLTCTASNSVANVSASQMAYFAVRSQPIIYASSAIPTEGEELVLTCNASHSIPAPTFMWTRDGVPITNSPRTMIQTSSEVGREGVLTYASDLTISSLQTTDSGMYLCSLNQNDPMLNSPLNSFSIPFNVTVNTRPELTFNPVDATILNDVSDLSVVVAVCSATGVPVPNIAWNLMTRQNLSYTLDPSFPGVEISNTVMNGSIISRLTLSNVTIEDRDGTLNCTATNIIDSVSDFQMPYFAVRAQPILNTTRAILTEGEEVTLTCSSDFSIPPPVFKWTKGGVQLTNSSSTIIAHTVAVGMYMYQSQLSIPATQLSDSGDYVCVVIQNDPRLNSPLTRSTPAITVDVNRFDDCVTSDGMSPCQNNGMCIDADGTYFCQCVGNFDGRNCEISASPQDVAIVTAPESGNFNVETQITLSCIAQGVPTPTITWFFNGQISNDLLPVPNITFTAAPDTRGLYVCRASNGRQTVMSSSAYILLNDIQQYDVGLSLTPRRRRQSSSGQTLQEIVASTVGEPVGSMGVHVYSAMITSTSNGGASASVLYTLRRPEGVEFSGGVTGALMNTISSASPDVIVTSIRRFDACSAETASGYTWPETPPVPVNMRVELPCQCNSTDIADIFQGGAVRECAGSFETGAMWRDPDITACTFDTYVQEICRASPDDVFNAISSGVSSSTTQSVNLTLSIVTEALARTGISLQTLDGVADGINALLVAHTDAAVVRDLRRNGITFVNNILEDIERLGEGLGGISYDQPLRKNLLQVRFQRVPTSALTANDFYTVEPGSPGVIFNSEVARLFSGSMPLVLANINARSIGSQGRQGTISETLISVSTGSVEVSQLSSNIQILFPEVTPNDNPIACVFWDPRLNSGYGNWSDEGCSVDKSDDGEARCNCNHLSTFAVFFGEPLPTIPPTPMPEEIFEISVIIYVALILSCLILLVLILTYVIAKELRNQAQVWFTYSALIAFYIAYMVSTAARQLNDQGTDGQRACGFFSALFQYTMLVYFFWTAAEAVFLVLMARNTSTKNIPTSYLLLATLICLITPVIIVAISLGGYQYFLSDSFCRPTNWPFYFGLVAPVVLITLFNVLMYLVAIKSLWGNYGKLSKRQFMYRFVYIILAITLLVFFAIEWIFGMTGSNNTFTRNTYVTHQYIFSGLAFIHSLLVVFSHIIRSGDARRSWYGCITCNRNIKRSYSTAGGDNPAHNNPIYDAGTELQTSYPAAHESQAKEDKAPLTPEKKPLDNVYSPGPGATGEDMRERSEDNVRVNLNVDDDNDEDKVVTSL